jgi:methylmalonyl-CoA mutase cobalamin-binding subunit
MTLQRLILDYRSGEIVARVLYRSSLDGPNSGTKACARDVTGLVRAGLEDALQALEGRVDVVGVSGFTQREDILCIATPTAVHKKREARLA